MADTLQCISPIDGRVFVERPLADDVEIAAALARAAAAGPGWRATPLRERCAILSRAVENLAMDTNAIAQELTWQMGRPIAHAPGEIAGFAERARHMIAIAPAALADITPAPQRGFTRFIRRVPLGLCFVAAPWNYPYLTAVNAVWPALLAGNTVILKPSHQTPLSAERFAAVLAQAGLPEGVYQPLHLSHAGAATMMHAADFTCFTGSVAGGRAVRQALANGFKGAGLELGGKDPAYVRHDADIDHAVENLAEGAFFNAGQSCCAIERIYVHADVYDDFTAGLIRAARRYRLGDPRERETTLGPVVRASAADFVRGQIAEAVRAGARAMVDPKTFPADRPGSAYMAPQVLINVDHSMRVMREESFGPVVGVMRVRSDAEAIALMNDSDYGLTAAVWTRDEKAALALGEQVETGTWFMNRCDYLDPALAWTGVKNSGHGCTLSPLGFEQLTRPKSFHLRTVT
ncbi:MAG: aldehyde dehydrogenase family protein [Alphaproteobacteria bacterium]